MIGEMIAQGNTAEVYLWGDKEVLKLFRQKFPWEGVEREYRVSKEVEKLGLPVPRVGQLIEVEGRKGITYEKVLGPSLLQEVTRHPLSMSKYAEQLAAIQYKLHQCKVEELPSYKEALEWNIRHTEALTDTERFEILEVLERLPEMDCLCHGDLHPGNIIADMDRTVVLDWMTAAAGCPSADVARTLLLLEDAALPDGINGLKKLIMIMMRKRIANKYLKKYLRLSGVSKDDITNWRLPIIAARLTEWVPEQEKLQILKELNKTMKSHRTGSTKEEI